MPVSANMLNLIKNKDGQGLIEAIAGISIIIVGLTGAIAVAQSSLSSNYEAETRVVAANLAREAVEVVHNIRDSNWLAGNNWDMGLYSLSDYDGVLILNYINNTWSIGFSPDDFTDSNTAIYRFISGAYKNLFTQANAQPEDTEKTFYKRLLSLKAICLSTGAETIENSAVCSAGSKVGIRVIAEMRWEEHARAHSLVVEDSIYNWR